MNTSKPTQVTIDRVVQAMAEHTISLVPDSNGRSAQATINGFDVMFALLDSVLIVRTAAATEIPSDSPDPTVYLAANQVNASLLDARAVVVNNEPQIQLRTEAEVKVAAGLNDEQLSSACTRAVEAILNAQDALAAIAEEVTAQRDALAAD